ncbi:reverse transcriptase domain-containing protein [Tanacetum coccineum]
MPPKRTSTSEAPAMTQAAIKKLVADSVFVALEALATGTLTEKSIPGGILLPLPIGIEEAFQRITWVEFKKLLITKHTLVQVSSDLKQQYDNRRTFNNNNYRNTNTNNSTIITNHNRTEDRKPSGPCTVKCNTCNKVGHLTKNCRNKRSATGSNLLPVKLLVMLVGEKGHYDKFSVERPPTTMPREEPTSS